MNRIWRLWLRFGVAGAFVVALVGYPFGALVLAGILALLDASITGPVNIGNPDEHTVLDLARTVLEVTGSSSEIVHAPLPVDDPTRRRPDKRSAPIASVLFKLTVSTGGRSASLLETIVP